MLVHYGAELNRQNQYGRTALHLAADNGNLYLSLNSFNIFIPISSQFVSAGSDQIAEMLIDKHANLNIQDKDGYTPLTKAVYRSIFLILKY